MLRLALIVSFIAATIAASIGRVTKSNQKCSEYTSSAEAFCYLTNESEPIVGQQDFAKPKEFPSLAFLVYEDGINQTCVGTLISEKFVLTAAQCITGLGAPIGVVIGDTDLLSAKDGSKPHEYDISQIYLHPGHFYGSYDHDLALLKLKTDVKFCQHIRPLCLESPNDDKEFTKFISAGWESRKKGERWSGKLKKAQLDYFDVFACSKVHEKDGFIEIGQGTHVCAGKKKEEKSGDFCGSLGTPLLVRDPVHKCMYNLIGTLSYIRHFCETGIPAVYTRISHYRAWIEQVVWG